MGIFSRFNRVLKSNLNSLMDKAEDPAKLIDHTVNEMERELKRAKKELVQTLGTAKRLEKKRKSFDDEVASWEDKAVLALKSGDEELAREALKFKQKAARDADEVANQAAHAEKAAFEMKDTLDEIEQKIEDLKARKGSLAAKVRRARADPNDDLISGRGGAFGDLERLAGRVDQLESEIEAHEIIDDPSERELERRFRDLERSSGRNQLDDELEALKRRLEE